VSSDDYTALLACVVAGVFIVLWLGRVSRDP
jgi:hypothetical protein